MSINSPQPTLPADYIDEEECSRYLYSGERILGMKTILKQNMKPRRVNLVLRDDEMAYLAGRRGPTAKGFRQEFMGQEYHKEVIRRVYQELLTQGENALSDRCYGRSSQTTNRDAFIGLRACITQPDMYVIRGDFKDFFHRIDLVLLDRLLCDLYPDRPELIALVTRLNTMLVWDLTFDGYEFTHGVKQGLSPATFLANLYLKEFDGFCAGLLPQRESYIRYVDDFAIVVGSRQEADNVLGQIRDFLKLHYPSLELHPEKTYIVPSSNCEYLGYTFSSIDHEITLTRVARAVILEKIRELAGKWRKAQDIEHFTKQDFNRYMGALRLQLSIVEDQTLLMELWNFLLQVVKDTFDAEYPRMAQKRNALWRLGIPMGHSIALIRNRSPQQQTQPFSAWTLQGILPVCLSREEVSEVTVE